MPFRDIMDPGQLRMLTAVVDEYCRKHGVQDQADRDDIARRAIRLYDQNRTSPNDLLQAMERDD